MTGKVEIINMALARLGESPIQSENEDTVPATQAKLLYDPARRAALRDYNWAFALKTAKLARLADAPDGFRYAFALPADCLRVVRLLSENRAYAVRQGKLCTNADTVSIEYIFDATDETYFDSKFIEAFSYRLASDLAMPVKGSTELMGAYSNMYQDMLKRAAAESLGESRTPTSCNPYLEERYGGY